MIGYLSGKIIYLTPPELLLDVNGVGYKVTLPLSSFLTLGDVGASTSIYVHTTVREDDISLYGFNDLEQRGLFRELLKVNGIGAKMAIAILSSMNVDEFVQCIENKNITQLTRLPGIGKKTAERMLLDLQDRLKSNTQPTMKHADNRYSKANSQALQALVNLGYKTHEAERLIANVNQDGLGVSELIKQALAGKG